MEKANQTQKHIGIKRIVDHTFLALNLKNFLKNNAEFKPDKIFLGYPPIETSLIIILWAKKFNIPVMIDVKDNWPINFIEPFPNFLNLLSKLQYFLIFVLLNMSLIIPKR